MAAPDVARFQGSFTLLVTPFGPDGRIDERSYAALVEHHLAAGAQGLFTVCGTGEMADLTPQERLWLARAAASRAGGCPVVATANLEAGAADQAQEVARMSATGVAGVVLVPPRVHAGEPEALFDHFAALARAASVPVLLYEWPGSRPAEVPPAVYGRLVEECGVVGIKDTTCTRAGLAAKVAAAPTSVVYQANNPLLVPALRAGARGTMTIASAARPDLLAKVWRDHLAGRDQDLKRTAREVVFLDGVLGGQHPAGAKWLLNEAGVLADARTRRGRPLTDAALAALRAWRQGAPPWAGR